MELNLSQRWILSNQYRILKMLEPDRADHYDDILGAIENGYSLHYDEFSHHIDRVGLSRDQCSEILDILQMFRILRTAYETLEDQLEIEEHEVQFFGFDGNVEGRQMLYAWYFCNLEGGRFTELGLETIEDCNSHMPALETYRRMLEAWNRSEDKYELGRGDIQRIVSARYPDRH